MEQLKDLFLSDSLLYYVDLALKPAAKVKKDEKNTNFDETALAENEVENVEPCTEKSETENKNETEPTENSQHYLPDKTVDLTKVESSSSSQEDSQTSKPEVIYVSHNKTTETGETEQTHDDSAVESTDKSYSKLLDTSSSNQAVAVADLVQNYLRLHGLETHERQPSPLVNPHQQVVIPKVTPLSSPAINLNNPINGNLRDLQSSLLTADIRGIQILVGEQFLDQFPDALLTLAEREVKCLDFPLEEPLTAIIDTSTGICLIPIQVLKDKEQLSIFVKDLTHIIFKFRTIWIILQNNVTDDNKGASRDDSIEKDKERFLQALSRFPTNVVVRECDGVEGTTDKNLALMILDICKHSATEFLSSPQVLKSSKSAKSQLALYLQRPQLELLTSDLILSVHCEYLQLFPTINYFLAAQILAVVDLKDIGKFSSARELRRKLKEFFGDLVVDQQKLDPLDFFLILFHAHAGLVVMN